MQTIKKPSGCFGVASAHASTLLICRKDADKKKDKLKAGLTVGLSGREMFTFDPTMMGHEVSFHFRVFQFLDSSFLIALFASNKDKEKGRAKFDPIVWLNKYFGISCFCYQTSFCLTWEPVWSSFNLLLTLTPTHWFSLGSPIISRAAIYLPKSFLNNIHSLRVAPISMVKPTSTERSGLGGGAIRCQQHISF